MSNKKRKKRKKLPLPPLYRAAVDYIEQRDGHVILIGGVSLLRLPDDSDALHHLVIDFVGEAPKLGDNTKP